MQAMPVPSRRLLLLLAAVALVGTGCPDRDLGLVRPVVQSGTKIVISQPESSAVDLLVMVDNSNSMGQEQQNLTENFAILLNTLTAPRPGEETPLVEDLHVGVISTDMGTGGFAVQTCRDAIDGDNGILLNAPSDEVAGCEASYPSYLAFGENGDPAALNDDFACVATLGTGGCGFEQQLESVRKALVDNAGDGGPNEGFLRNNSLLALLLVTDEEDCSIKKTAGATDIFNTQLALGPLNLRCHNHADQYVEPVDTYVDAILDLRRDDPTRLVVAAIVGIPSASRNDCNLENMSDSDFQCLLDLPDMQEVIDNSAEGRGERLTPSCDDPGLGEAFPPRRIVQFVRGVTAVSNAGIVRSICDADWEPAMEAITALIAGSIDDACLARPLEQRETGQVDCIIQEQMTTADDCGPGRINMGLDGDGHRLCQICQQGDGRSGRLVDELGTDLTPCAPFNDTGDFWRYLTPEDADCEGRAKIEFAGDSIPAPGSTASLECLSQIGR